MNVETSTHLGSNFYLKRSLGLLRNPRRMASPKVAQLRSASKRKFAFQKKDESNFQTLINQLKFQ